MAQKIATPTVVGIAFIVVGVLLLLGRFSLGWLLDVMGFALIVLGVLILVNVLPGGMPLGLLALILGILLLANILEFPRELREPLGRFMDLLNLVAGVILIVVGALRLR